MKELVFSIKDVFSTTTASGCLSQYNAQFFHIPAYQRGYKWSSEPTGAVSVLLSDLWGKFQQDADEYYLQYITVKPLALQKGACLEVIDGQQRLTTLSILLSVLNSITGDKADEANISYKKLDYAVRANFFDDYIYPGSVLRAIAQKEWQGFIEQDGSVLDKQDVYYLHGAAKACYEFLIEEDEDCRQRFKSFVLSKTKLIVNSIEPHIQSETVFKNLNSNKVPLTEAELIKALLITRAGRSQVKDADSHFLQVTEVRLGISRVWEGIQEWSQRVDIRSFFFNDSPYALLQLLELTALQLGASSAEVKAGGKNASHPLFNYYNDKQNISAALEKLVEVQLRLDDFYQDDELYHLMGFCRFVKNSEYRQKNIQFLNICLNKTTRRELVDWLNEWKGRFIFKGVEAARERSEAIRQLQYGEDDAQIHAVLLALSVFINVQPRPRFNFEAFSRQQWSLEHIFPQSPEGKQQVLNDEDRRNILDMLKTPSEDIQRVLEKAERSLDEKLLVADALKKGGKLDNIGNMCLLSGSNNASLGCKFFTGKRKTILELIQQGSFVPKHTFDVFSKMITGLDDDLRRWSEADIHCHADYIGRAVIEAAMVCDV